MFKEASKWLYLVSTFLFGAATFQIADGGWILGAVFFAAAVAFMATGRVCQKKEADGRQPRA